MDPDIDASSSIQVVGRYHLISLVLEINLLL